MCAQTKRTFALYVNICESLIQTVPGHDARRDILLNYIREYKIKIFETQKVVNNQNPIHQDQY